MTYQFSTDRDATGIVLDVGGDRGRPQYTRLQVVRIDGTGEHSLRVDDEELVAIPLSGGFDIEREGEVHRLAGRESPIHELTDFLYVEPHSAVTIRGERGARIALAFAKAERGPATRVVAREEVGVSIRGGGTTSRQINALVGENAAESTSIIIGEILTPGGGWSSYPAHKHDDDSEEESELEEIYYFEIDDGEGPEGHGFAYQRVWSADDRELDILAEAKHGDAIAIPHGWHGPVAVAPGCTLYNLYLMAGPNGPTWNITDHPEQTWIRSTWDGQPPHSSLPIAQ
ncbi:5-deoxy-glucuronate isomerase [Gulosibacter sp. 10]|uniref:5-deoxy-glucuronate isomerase n=1 Tax=Gulosibacter sp. 10 TaxID=1255570 RepID=UPI00097EC53D|nr:5-deoxy-glucuronate isomerase [Gulosibacter sp. 10]SJM64000.1 5-deoxy-glucuronate isomerase [Gulosibacter sp. 10]